MTDSAPSLGLSQAEGEQALTGAEYFARLPGTAAPAAKRRRLLWQRVLAEVEQWTGPLLLPAARWPVLLARLCLLSRAEKRRIKASRSARWLVEDTRGRTG